MHTTTLEAAAVTTSDVRGLRIIHNLEVTPERRGQGEATAALQALITQADADGSTLATTVHAGDGTTSIPRLERWLHHHGFRFTGGNPAWQR